MECFKCRTRKDISEFSLKNSKENIYYLHCDKCRENVKQLQTKHKEKMREDYELKKTTNLIKCECGISFVAFRDFHMIRHVNSKRHQNYLHKDKCK